MSEQAEADEVLRFWFGGADERGKRRKAMIPAGPGRAVRERPAADGAFRRPG